MALKIFVLEKKNLKVKIGPSVVHYYVVFKTIMNSKITCSIAILAEFAGPH